VRGVHLVTKSDLVLSIAEELHHRNSDRHFWDISQREGREIVQLTLDSIIDGLVVERRFELRNFGVFEVRTRKARIGRNPKSGAVVLVPEKKVVMFSAGKVMGASIAERNSPSAELTAKTEKAK